MKSLSRLLLAACAAAFAGTAALAHDFWIEPKTHRAQAQSLLGVALVVGDFGKGDRMPRNDERIVQFVCVGPDGAKPIVGRDGNEPAGYVRLQSDGLYVLGYRSSHASVEIEPAKFTAYLHERGLEDVLELRKQRGESERPAREVYSRCSKSLVGVGAGASTGFDTVLNFTLELTPEKNPMALRPGTAGAPYEPLPVRLFYEGKPLANALVGATSLDAPPNDASDPTNVLHARTDADGRVELALPRKGRWLIAAVHMIPASNHAEADWESFWASFTFEIP
jgi:uncharacterized GH25 family protein